MIPVEVPFVFHYNKPSKLGKHWLICIDQRVLKVPYRYGGIVYVY